MNVKATITLNLLLSAVVVPCWRLRGYPDGADRAGDAGPWPELRHVPERSGVLQELCGRSGARPGRSRQQPGCRWRVLGTVVSAGLGAAVGSAFGNAGGGAAIGLPRVPQWEPALAPATPRWPR